MESVFFSFSSLSPLLSLKGLQQQQGVTGSGARQVNPTAGRPPRPASIPPSDEGPQNKQHKPKIPVLEKHLINQLSSDEQNSINSKYQEATEADKKVTIVALFLCSLQHFFCCAINLACSFNCFYFYYFLYCVHLVGDFSM